MKQMNFLLKSKLLLPILLIYTIIISSCGIVNSQLKPSVYKSVGPYLYYYEGIQNRLYGNYEYAFKNLEKSLQLNPNNSAAYYELAISYANLGNYNQTQRYIEKAVELDPANTY